MRRSALCVGLGAGVLAVVAVFLLRSSAGVRPIQEYDNVFYSVPNQWADLYLNRAPAGIGWVHLPQPSEGGLFRSNTDAALQGFVRPQVCGECHSEKWQGLQETAHFRTSSEASPQTVLGKFGPTAGRLATRDPALHFEMIASDGGLYQRLVVQKGGQTYEHKARFDIVTGSGNHGQTYLYWQGAELYQLPISYFSESDRWINSPGFYRDGTADFARGITHRCLDCHSTYFAAAPGDEARFDRETYILGVTCVRCHGHGWAHVQYHRTHPADKTPRYIVHPGRLPRDRANEVCAQCHSGGGELLAPAFSYQPGEPLERYLRLDAGADSVQSDDPHAANQLVRLMKSRCYQESESLHCASCHDPHRQERGNLKLFAERCAQCHQRGDCKLSGVTHDQIADHCVECHMPSRRDVEGAMQTTQGDVLPLLRDHYIRIAPELTSPVKKKLLLP